MFFLLKTKAAHIQRTINIEADKQFRVLEYATEWKLNPALFRLLKNLENQTDLFATRIDKQLDGYVSWHPEPKAMTINVFSLAWNNNYFYMFQPFSLVDRVLAKIHRDKTNTITIVPDWSTQYWYLQLLQMTNEEPLDFRASPKNLTLPRKYSVNHLLYKKLQLIAIRVIILQKKC